MTPLERLLTLRPKEQTTFLAYCAAPLMRDMIFVDGQTGEVCYPNFGKAECGWVDDWRGFYQHKLVALGLVDFEETEPRPALGMVAGSTYIEVTLWLTDDGKEAREGWWARLREPKEGQTGQIGEQPCSGEKA